MSYENIESPGNPIYKCNFDKWPEKYIPKNEKNENKYLDIRQTNTFNNKKRSYLYSPLITKKNSMDNIKIINIYFRKINSEMAIKIEASLYDSIGKIIQKYINQTGASGKFKYKDQEIKNFSLSIEEIGIQNEHTIFVFNN